MSREIMQQALNAFEAIMFETDAESCQIIAKNARYALREELAKPEQDFYPDWDMIKPYHDRIAELEAQLAEQEQEKPEWQELYKDEIKEILNDGEEWSSLEFAQAVSDLLRQKNT